MPKEIERKFLLKGDFPKSTNYEEIIQGYIPRGNDSTVRIRIASLYANERLKGETACITIKSKTEGISRDEYEYKIPIEEAQEMLNNMCEGIIEKTRYTYSNKDTKFQIWEIDVFKGDNEGLIVAEIELRSQFEQYKKPIWIGEEVSFDKRYFNASLSKNPYKNWETN